MNKNKKVNKNPKQEKNAENPQGFSKVIRSLFSRPPSTISPDYKFHFSFLLFMVIPLAGIAVYFTEEKVMKFGLHPPPNEKMQILTYKVNNFFQEKKIAPYAFIPISLFVFCVAIHQYTQNILLSIVLSLAPLFDISFYTYLLYSPYSIILILYSLGNICRNISTYFIVNSFANIFWLILYWAFFTWTFLFRCEVCGLGAEIVILLYSQIVDCVIKMRAATIEMILQTFSLFGIITAAGTPAVFSLVFLRGSLGENEVSVQFPSPVGLLASFRSSESVFAYSLLLSFVFIYFLKLNNQTIMMLATMAVGLIVTILAPVESVGDSYGSRLFIFKIQMIAAAAFIFGAQTNQTYKVYVPLALCGLILISYTILF